MDVKAKYQSGQPIKAIARETGISRNTRPEDGARQTPRDLHLSTILKVDP